MSITVNPHPEFKDCVTIEGQTYKATTVKDMDGDGKKETAYILADEQSFLGLAWVDKHMGTSNGYVRLSSNPQDYLEASIKRERHYRGRGSSYVTTAVIAKNS